MVKGFQGTMLLYRFTITGQLKIDFQIDEKWSVQLNFIAGSHVYRLLV